MTLLSINKLTCQQGIKLLFDSATFSVDEKDKIAVIGPNGSGKTTLLSLISAAIDSPLPEIAVKKGLRVSTLSQNPDVDPNHSIQDHLFKSQAKASVAIQNYHRQLERYNNDQSPEIETAFTAASEEMDHLNLWEYEDRVNSILRELNISQLDQKIKDLSGGMRKKIALAQTFFEDSELLILDEPTNHLDITTIEWLEGMLKKQQSAIVMVTHDRYFLDKVCTKIIEIDQQQVFVYNGNYQTYLEQRAQRYLAQEKQESSIQSVLRVELAWLKRGPKARSTKQKARKERIGNMMARKVFDAEDELSLNVSERRLGKKILELKNVSKSFAERLLIRDFSYAFSKGKKIGVLGPNGVGKSTLLNLIMEKLMPDSGEIEVGVNTVFGYFDQHSGDFDLNQTVYEHVSEIGSQFVCPDGATLSASKLLERFLFPSSMLKTTIGKLSGGERRRLHLVCLLLKNPNFLLFDEPTNDLDTQTLSVLEDFLLSFSGCVILISHDRYLMDRVVNHLLVFDKDAQITPFQGNYSEYVDILKDATDMREKQAQTPEKKDSLNVSGKRTNRECEEMKHLESEVARLELEKDSLAAIFASPNSTSGDFETAGKQMKAIVSQLDEALARWEVLAEKD